MSSETIFRCDECGAEYPHDKLHDLRGSVDFQLSDGRWINAKVLVYPTGKEPRSPAAQLDLCPECRKPYITEYARRYAGFIEE